MRRNEQNVLLSAFLNLLDASSGSTLLKSSSSLVEGSAAFPRPCPRAGALASSSLESPFYPDKIQTYEFRTNKKCVGTDVIVGGRKDIFSLIHIGCCILSFASAAKRDI